MATLDHLVEVSGTGPAQGSHIPQMGGIHAQFCLVYPQFPKVFGWIIEMYRLVRHIIWYQGGSHTKLAGRKTTRLLKTGQIRQERR